MTRIDFHSNIADVIGYACRLTRKARVADCTVVILTQDTSQMRKLDEALWRFSERDFLPHVCVGDPLMAQTPIVLTDSDTVDLPHYQILINLSAATPVHFARFERLFEIVPNQAAETLAARARYVFYKQRGYLLTHFDAEKS